MNLKEVNVDLNSLFHFNVNFDSLKIMLEHLNSNQHEMIMKINRLDAIVNTHQRNFKRMHKGDSQLSEENEGEDGEDNKQDRLIEESKEMRIEAPQEEVGKENEGGDEAGDREKKTNDLNDTGQFNRESGDSMRFAINPEIKELKKKVSIIESNIKRIFYSKPSFNNQQEVSILTHPQPSKARQSTNSDAIAKQIKELSDKLAALTSSFNDLSVKVDEINAGSHLMGKDCPIEEGGDIAKTLIATLEQKLFKKFALIDEKSKQLTDDQFKVNKVLNDIRVRADSNDDLLDQMEKQVRSFNEMLQDSTNAIDKVEHQLNSKAANQQKTLNDLLKEVNGLSESLIKCKEDIGTLSKESKPKGPVLTENDLEMLKDFFKKVNELERGLKTLWQSFSMDSIKEDIRKLKAELTQKSNSNDMYDINDKVNLHSTVIAALKDTNEKLIEDRAKLAFDSNLMMKKLESLNAAVVTMRSNEESNQLINKANAVDTSKFLEVAIFNEFLKANAKEQDRLMREDDNLSRILDEVVTALKTKVSDEDMRNIETCFIARIDEMKLVAQKKYADKSDTSKNLKYLDTQLKHIIDYYVKRNDKGDSWLLAKKPIGGFSCASCEAYIGDLNEKKDYLAWNKYPMRDTQDKAYRIGNGYSKLLGMLNVDIRNPNEGSVYDNQYESDGEAKNNPSSLTKLSQNLPNISSTNRAEDRVNMSVDLGEDFSHRTVDPNEPKVYDHDIIAYSVKIVKRLKNNSMDLSRNNKQ